MGTGGGGGVYNSLWPSRILKYGQGDGLRQVGREAVWQGSSEGGKGGVSQQMRDKWSAEIRLGTGDQVESTDHREGRWRAAKGRVSHKQVHGRA